MQEENKISSTEIYNAYCGDMFRYAYSLLLNKEDAEDIVQEIFTKHSENPGLFKGNCSLKTWLFTLTRNQCLDKLKRNKIFYSENEPGVKKNFYSPEQNIETKITLKEAIDNLSPEQNELLFLKDYVGYSYKEISELTNNSLENVKIKLFRTRKKLKEFISEKENK